MTVDPTGSTARAVVFRGGPVITMNESREILPAGTGVLSIDGRIAGFISAEHDEPADAQRVDLGSGPILPAFLDPHVHFGMTNDSLAYAVDCHTPPRGDIEELLDALRDGMELAEARQGWLLGQGSLMQDQKLRDKRVPDRHDLDRVSTTTPIVVRCGGHVTVLNTRALELSGLREYRHLDGSAELQRDPDGQPNGVVVEGFALVPIPSLDVHERRAALASTLDSVFTRNGVTYLGEISHSTESLEDIALLLETAPITVDAFVHLPDTVGTVAEAAALRERFTGTPLTIRGVKIFVDGGYSAQTAATKTPYVGGTNLGDLYYSLDELVNLISSSADHGLQLIAHVNGERAQTLVCEATRIATGGDRSLATTRLEHAGNFVPDLSITEQWMDAGVSIVSQPGFIYTMGPYFPSLFGAVGERGRFPYRTLREAGVPVGASSDVSGSELLHADPMFNVRCAVERVGFGGASVELEESIDVIAALEMQTVQAAIAAGVDKERGSIRPGLMTDLAVLSADPRAARGDELSRIRVAGLVRRGSLVLTQVQHIR